MDRTGTARAMRTSLALATVTALVGSILGAAQAASSSPIVGAWRLVAIEETQADGRTVRHADLKGSLIYTADGRLSVQVAYPSASVNNDYVHDGYEASFGSYKVDDRAHRVVHHVESANVPGLIGKDLPRTYRIDDRRMVVGPVDASEHWSVIWERE